MHGNEEDVFFDEDDAGGDNDKRASNEQPMEEEGSPSGKHPHLGGGNTSAPVDDNQEEEEDEDPAGGDQNVSAKFLLSNACAGSVIGKGGVTISEFQAQSGARIQLSRNREYFPGTQERILLLTGSVNAILTALHLILSKLLAEEPASMDDSSMGSPSSTTTIVKLVVPSAVCGGIIGKGGSTIRSYVEDSGAAIKLSGQDLQVPGVHERIITITGTLEQQLRAVALIVTKMAEDPNFPVHSSVTLAYSSAHMAGAHGHSGDGYHGGGGERGGSRNQGQSGYQGNMPMAATAPVQGNGPNTTVTVAVPDEHIGALMGRGGKYISEMQQMSGVRIKISDRNDFVSGTRNRKVTLSGPLEAVQIAQFLISQKVQQSAADMQTQPPTRESER
mmetsp:Transcript_21593/g.30011  ORF Transcript_21593/g.30011 Transcript_21593/m.30011 type:complete len:389 (-) Transcript_21593:200-1366(-)|eukprot:CAMPEP_0196570318 /NCGR_PEP_ID=MMETSP1081-20130531/354_1 /TAXON_ID=36882 /ORGANISM="Pyramimonas amylifera, Strain CCMP720" /LENGTH=388 /DNA_ID=CAMNT_0041886691 /DNA_START=173 /DNA_END=1339 /DNA_ORIENTATION=-